jgi:hypothetical protein
MRPLVARCERSLARIARARGDDSAADELHGRAQILFTALGMPDVAR